jgi:hypothetical protein
VGTATGITLAMANAPNGVVEASSGSVQSSSTRAEAETNLAVNSNVAPIDQTAVTAPLATSPSQPVSGTGHFASKAANPRLSTANPAVKAQPSPEGRAVKPATFRLAGKEWPVARPMPIPVSEPVRHQVASAAVAAPTALNPTLSSIDHAAKPAIRYIEGDLTIAAYDAMTGTLQTSDGRTFILGTSVAAGNVTSWDEYRSGVHYRCDQGGSCMLMRAGAVAPSARLI